MGRVQSWLVAVVTALSACEFLGPSALRPGPGPDSGARAGDSNEPGGNGDANGGAQAGGGGDSGATSGTSASTTGGGTNQGGSANGGGTNGGRTNGGGTHRGGSVSGANGAGAEVSGGMGGGSGSGDDGGASGSAGKASDCSQQIDGMVCVHGATFPMGQEPDLVPIHDVTVASFYVDITEVTVAAYAACVSSGYCVPPHTPADSDECNWGVPERDRHPVNCTDLLMAMDYCRWVDKRLPTEAEWDYAALRGSRKHPWGDSPPTTARVNVCGAECPSGAPGCDEPVITAPVGSFPGGATPDGIQDLGGNVWEALESRFCPYPDSPCTDCPLGYSCAHSCECDDNPYWATRGGSCFAPSAEPQTSFRGSGGYGWNPYTGFRCVRDAQPRPDPPRCATVDSGRLLSVGCPKGQIISAVIFASYGEPEGLCHYFTAGACDAPDSAAIVSAACVGKQRCDVPATYTVFGEACPGNERLAVEVSCEND